MLSGVSALDADKKMEEMPVERKDWLEQCSQAEKEALYRAEIENYMERMVLNNEGHIVFINEKYASEFGHHPSELEGIQFEELYSDRKAPVLLNLDDFATPYAPWDSVETEDRRSIFIRAPLCGENGEKVGDMIYDGQGWLQRYRSLYDKLNELMDEYEYLHPTKKRPPDASFIGSSPAIVKIKKEIFQVAKSNANLLIEGETGVGKEVVANEVFRASSRSGKRFVKLNCAALPQELIESELFGYAEGAFTGARRSGKKGLFEFADGGVILLDEINSLGLPAQAKLLRVLQERIVNPIGSTKAIPINVRVIAISNCSLEEMVREKSFREDLFYRLNVLHISVPPLRERTEDIPELVTRFIKRCNEEMDKNVEKIDPKVFSFLKSCPWPGNVRQLQNWVDRAMTTVWKNVITLDNFYWISEKAHKQASGAAGGISACIRPGVPLPEMMDQVEIQIIKAALERSGGNKSAAAAELGISRQMLHRKIRQFHIG